MNKPKCSQLILLLLLHPKNYIIVNCVIFQWNFLLKFLILERFINKWAHTPTQQNPYLHDLAMKFCLFSFHFLREIAFQMPLNVVQTNCFFFCHPITVIVLWVKSENGKQKENDELNERKRNLMRIYFGKCK